MRNVLQVREAGWLGRSLTLLIALAVVALLPVALVVGWSVDAVGAVYQVLGIAIAGIGVPIVAPRLREAEQALDRGARRARAWVRTRRDALRRWWRRRRRVTQSWTMTADVSGTSAGASGGSANLTVTGGTAEELAALRSRVETLERAQAEHAADVQRQLAEQRVELRAHTVSVTQEGWQYILSGAACSAFGTILPLFG
jgi:hypothetical protein